MRCGRARDRVARRPELLGRTALRVVAVLGDGATLLIRRPQQRAVGVVVVADDVAELVALLRLLERQRIDPCLVDHARIRTRAGDGGRERRVGEVCRGTRDDRASLREALRRGHARDAPLRVVGDLRHGTRVLRAESVDGARGDDARRERRARLHDAAAAVPADVRDAGVRARAEARDDPRDLWAGRVLLVLEHGHVARPVEHTAEIALRRRDEARVGRLAAAVLTAVEEGRRVLRDGVDKLGEPASAPHLLDRRRVEVPHVRRMPVGVNRWLREDGDRAVAVGGAERAVRVLREQRRLPGRGVAPDRRLPLVAADLRV